MQILKDWLANSKINIADNYTEQIAEFRTLLYSWNKVHNLTRIDSSRFEALHIVDSLVPLVLVKDFKKAEQIIDLGTGAGFPGLPLAIACPKIQFTLLDSSEKKILFINHVCTTLGLKNVKALPGRIEHLNADPDHSSKYDFVLSRAMASLEDFFKLAKNFISPNGRYIIYKSMSGFDEIKETAWQQYSSVLSITPYILPDLEEQKLLLQF